MRSRCPFKLIKSDVGYYTTLSRGGQESWTGADPPVGEGFWTKGCPERPFCFLSSGSLRQHRPSLLLFVSHPGSDLRTARPPASQAFALLAPPAVPHRSPEPRSGTDASSFLASPISLAPFGETTGSLGACENIPRAAWGVNSQS